MRQLNIIILLALIITFFTACSKRDLGLSSSAPPSVANDQSQSQAATSDQAPASSSSADQAANAADKYADILRSGTYYIDCTAVIAMEGMQLENPMLIAVKGGNSSISVSSDLSGTSVTIRTLVFDGEVYRINDAQRSYMKLDPEQSANSFDTDFSELRYIGESSASFSGETRPCSEYARGEQAVRFFFDGGALIGMTQSITDEQVEEVMLKIKGLSSNIPGKLVELPIGYTKE